MRTFLVPCDGSSSALKAVQYAVSLAKDLREAKIELLNVQEPALVREHALRSAQEIRHVQADAADRILRAAAELPQVENVPCEMHWRVGSPAEEIVRQAHDGQYAAIVMGTRGLGTVAGILLGSVSAKVVHATDTPVTLVK